MVPVPEDVALVLEDSDGELEGVGRLDDVPLSDDVAVDEELGETEPVLVGDTSNIS